MNAQEPSIDELRATPSLTPPDAKVAEPAEQDSSKEALQDEVRFIGRHRIVESLGQGGFGEVFRAHDPMLDRDVAVKLHHSRSAGSHSAEILLNEGRRIAKLNHEGIVRVLDAGLIADELYLVSEFMPGGTLQQRLQQGEVSRDDAVRDSIALADALHHAHLRGYVHRDIKPSNILYDENGHPRLADFGLAASEEELARERPATLGTITYMSPEQAKGQSNLVDPRSDIYSLGLVLYRMLTGRLPFTGDSLSDIREQIAHREPRPLRLIDDSIPESLEQICLKCLSTSITERYTTAQDLKQVLQDWQASSTPTVATPPPSRNSTRAPMLVAGALGMVALIGYLVASSFSSLPSEDKANGSAGATSVVGDSPAQTSMASPEVVVWHPYDSHDKHSYDAEKRLYHMDAFGISMFQIGEKPDADVLQLQATFSVSRWIGLAGVFWQRNPNMKYASGSRAIKVGRYREDQPFVVELCVLSVGTYAGAQQTVTSEQVLATFKPQFELGRNAFLEVRIQGSSHPGVDDHKSASQRQRTAAGRATISVSRAARRT